MLQNCCSFVKNKGGGGRPQHSLHVADGLFLIATVMEAFRRVCEWCGCLPEGGCHVLTEKTLSMGWLQLSASERRRADLLRLEELIQWVDRLPTPYPGIDDDIQNCLFAPLPVQVRARSLSPLDFDDSRSTTPASSVGLASPADLSFSGGPGREYFGMGDEGIMEPLQRPARCGLRLLTPLGLAWGGGLSGTGGGGGASKSSREIRPQQSHWKP